MSQSIQAVITKLAEIEAGLSGIKAAYDETPEALTVFPCFINYPRRGTYKCGGGPTKEGTQTIRCELHVTRQILPQAETVARPYIDSFVDAVFADPNLGGACVMVTEIRWEYGNLEFAGETHLGIQFEVDCRIRKVI